MGGPRDGASEAGGDYHGTPVQRKAAMRRPSRRFRGAIAGGRAPFWIQSHRPPSSFRLFRALRSA